MSMTAEHPHTENEDATTEVPFVALSNDEVRAMGIDPNGPDAIRALLARLTGQPVKSFTIQRTDGSTVGVVTLAEEEQE